MDVAHLVSARVLRLVLAVDTRREVNQVGRMAAQRAITIADIADDDAERLCAVLQAAGTLSAGGVISHSKRGQHPAHTDHSTGTDIDS
ncbi:MAG: hypothetical protein Aurels2KO_57420 [Aureliella sp.]